MTAGRVKYKLPPLHEQFLRRMKCKSRGSRRVADRAFFVFVLFSLFYSHSFTSLFLYLSISLSLFLAKEEIPSLIKCRFSRTKNGSQARRQIIIVVIINRYEMHHHAHTIILYTIGDAMRCYELGKPNQTRVIAILTRKTTRRDAAAAAGACTPLSQPFTAGTDASCVT